MLRRLNQWVLTLGQSDTRIAIYDHTGETAQLDLAEAEMFKSRAVFATDTGPIRKLIDQCLAEITRRRG